MSSVSSVQPVAMPIVSTNTQRVSNPNVGTMNTDTAPLAGSSVPAASCVGACSATSVNTFA